VDGLGIDCRYCHTSVEQSSFAGLPSTAEGERDFHTRGCSGCHAANSQIRAPLLEGIYGKPVPLSDGTIVIADEQYLRDSILLPNKQIAAGYEPVMPTFQGRISEEEVNAIVAYLKYLTDSERSQQ
jgi:cytochrome c oxidase subunit 2